MKIIEIMVAPNLSLSKTLNDRLENDEKQRYKMYKIKRENKWNVEEEKEE